MDTVRVPPDALVPPIGSILWPNMVPNHGITIVDGLQESGQPTLHVAFSTDTPPWVLIGLLESALQDVKQAWEHGMFDPHQADLDDE